MNQPKSLKELVDLAIQFRGASGLGLSQLAAKNGLQITTTTINAIRQGTYKSTPREGTLRALAWLAGVDASVAFTAAGQPVPGPPFAEELPPGVDNLPPKARKAAIDMLRVLVDLNRDADEWKHAHEKERRRGILREAGFASARQKTDEPDGADTLAAKRRAGKLIAEHKARERRAAEYPDNNIPLPRDYLDLAAHPSGDSPGRREVEEASLRGETSQEQGD